MDLATTARERWLLEKPVYTSVGEDIKESITLELKKHGISTLISSRVKETDSLLKKIVRKNSLYDSIHDKVGVRIVVPFKKQMNEIDTIICQLFKDELRKREDMSEKLGEAIFGYQSIHYDICKRIGEIEYFCELQLRTICQNNWSELSHTLAYKTEIELPLDIKRELNALSAVFELADNQFQLINNLIEGLPDANPIRLINYLEPFFYSNIGAEYDRELTAYFLKDIQIAYDNENPKLKIDSFIAKFEQRVIDVVKSNSDNLYFTQPEIVIILERLSNSKYSFIDFWNNLYPNDDLEKIANAWGTSIT
ncbi:MAG: hypothetical protein VB091_10055 [Christensenella sp.]|nr:hypothetical protein [Christensenella sp.]